MKKRLGVETVIAIGISLVITISLAVFLLYFAQTTAYNAGNVGSVYISIDLNDNTPVSNYRMDLYISNRGVKTIKEVWLYSDDLFIGGSPLNTSITGIIRPGSSLQTSLDIDVADIPAIVKVEVVYVDGSNYIELKEVPI